VDNSVDNLPPTPVDNSVDLDANGFPWDERIHSGGKTKLADGTWRDKRGVEVQDREVIENELKALMAVPVPELIAHAAPTDAEGRAQLTADIKENAPAPAAITTLPQFVKAITGAKIGTLLVNEAVKAVGLESITQLGARPDLIPAVAAELGL
jgi:hypothetical protein